MAVSGLGPFGALCLVGAGFFVYTACFIGFFDVEGMTLDLKLKVMAGFATPAVIGLALAMAAHGVQQWRRDVGLVLAGGAGLSVFALFGLLTVAVIPEQMLLSKRPDLSAFRDFTTGGIATAAAGVAGATLLWMWKRHRAQTSGRA